MLTGSKKCNYQANASQFDARNCGVMTPLTKQDWRESCWTFAGAGHAGPSSLELGGTRLLAVHLGQRKGDGNA